MSDDRRDLYSQSPRSTPKGYVTGLGEGVELLRRELAAGEIVRDALGNPVERSVVDLPTALGNVKRARPDLYRALADFSEDYPDPGAALLELIGDPTFSDIDTAGDPNGIPFYR